MLLVLWLQDGCMGGMREEVFAHTAASLSCISLSGHEGMHAR